MRLMGEEGEERPMDKYYRFKQNINLWYKEMDDFGLTREEQKTLEPYFRSSYGVPPSQEQLMKMLMDEHICHFTLGEANAARKVVGKKQMNKIPALHQKVLDQAASEKLGQYVWKYGAGPQMGYSFSVIHALAYSFIGVQTLYIATHWNPIYWNTACLVINSGSLEKDAEDIDGSDEDEQQRQMATDYAKLAKAIGDIRKAGIKVSLADINYSQFGFVPDVKNNQILFGLKGMLNVGDDVVAEIISNRPYSSIKDFYYRVKPSKQAMVSLIKGGAFDAMEERKFAMAWYIWETCDKKKRLTLQNMKALIEKDLLPKDEESILAKRVYEFNRYLKAMCKFSSSEYHLDSRALDFITELGVDQLIYQGDMGFYLINIKAWDKIYQKYMDIIRAWLSKNQEDVLSTLNTLIFQEDWNKYASGNYSSWEMEVLCFYYHEHELAHLNQSRYGFDNFFKLPESPEVDKMYKRGNTMITLYKLHKICGTCIAKNKTKSIVTLLTPDGVVNVKFRKEYFSLFDKQISERGPDGAKHVVEKSWFNRGSMIVVTGIRSGDDFISKKYASTGGHQLYKILNIDDQGNLTLQDSRYKGEEDV